jgi:homoserine kinase type II
MVDTHALAPYPLAAPVEPFALAHGGTNNDTFGLRTGAGAYVVKRYRTTGDRSALVYEHRLLRCLEDAGLPFRVPAPIPARDGETLVRDGDGWLALFPLLPGRPPQFGDAPQAGAVGEGLGRLHVALAHLTPEPHPSLGSHAEFGRVHDAIPDPAVLPLAGDDVAWWSGELSAMRAFVRTTYRVLPRQLIHGDFAPGNTLFEGERLVAVLDFEMAQPDARAIDVAAGLLFVLRPWEGPARWGAARAFACGYGHHVRLVDAEIGVLPSLIRLCNVVSVIWRFGHRPDEAVLRVERARTTGEWLGKYGERLVRVVAEEMGI